MKIVSQLRVEWHSPAVPCDCNLLYTNIYIAALSRGVSLQITNLRVAPNARTRLAYVRDLPCDVPDEPVKVFLCGCGVVHSLTPQAYPFIPNVLNGTKVTLAKDLPSSVRITGYDGLWYQGQPHVFPVCCLPGHCVKDCPFNGV